jgi:hypothetical protein
MARSARSGEEKKDKDCATKKNGDIHSFHSVILFNYQALYVYICTALYVLYVHLSYFYTCAKRSQCVIYLDAAAYINLFDYINEIKDKTEQL